MEFYNFLQVKTDSKPEVIHNSRKEEDEDEEDVDNCVPFFDFLSVGNSASKGLC